MTSPNSGTGYDKIDCEKGGKRLYAYQFTV